MFVFIMSFEFVNVDFVDDWRRIFFFDGEKDRRREIGFGVRWWWMKEMLV